MLLEILLQELGDFIVQLRRRAGALLRSQRLSTLPGGLCLRSVRPKWGPRQRYGPPEPWTSRLSRRRLSCPRRSSERPFVWPCCLRFTSTAVRRKRRSSRGDPSEGPGESLPSGGPTPPPTTTHSRRLLAVLSERIRWCKIGIYNSISARFGWQICGVLTAMQNRELGRRAA